MGGGASAAAIAEQKQAELEAEYQAKVSKMKADYANKQTELESGLAACENNNTDLSNNLNNTNTQLNARTNELNSTRSQLNARTNELNNTQKKLTDMTKDRDNIKKDRDNIIKDRDNIKKDRDNIIKDRDNIKKDRDNIIKDRANIIKDRDNIKKDRDNIKKDRDNKQSQLTAKTNELNDAKTCEKNLEKLIAAHRRLRSDGSFFVRDLYDNKHWFMYIVKNWGNFRQHKWYKYLWNIAIIFKETDQVICIYCSGDTLIRPGSQNYNFFRINSGFLTALAYNNKLTAYNIKEVVTNSELAKTVEIEFWGAYKQKPADPGYPIDALLGHENTATRHGNLNQTAWMWNWMINTVQPNKATSADYDAFNRSGRIIKKITSSVSNYNAGLKTFSMNGVYSKRPALPE